MYSVKEKMKLLRELHNLEYADADLRLLREVSPQNDLLRSPIVNVARSAEKILYTLLDQTTAEKIRLNRRASECENQPEKESKNENNEKQPDDTGSKEPDTPKQPEGDTQECPKENNTNGNANEVDVVQQLEETKEELGDTQSELENTLEELEDTQAELEDTKAELNAEKKSEPTLVPVPKNSKKKTSTRKSTGKTSSTKTSRSQR
ncbi:hypothetical protein [Parabacteroides johnsonii]|jgi:type IV secretory pathway VirB10-like protein|nr:MAG TPA: hypothetical protein [Caudoviricetes sp.]